MNTTLETLRTLTARFVGGLLLVGLSLSMLGGCGGAAKGTNTGTNTAASAGEEGDDDDEQGGGGGGRAESQPSPRKK